MSRTIPNSPSDSFLEIAPPSAFELLWINHRGAFLGGIALLVLGGLIVLGVMASAHTTRIASEALLSGATDEAGWRSVMAKYPRTPASANAMLLLAASLRDSGKLEESDELYSRFAETFPGSSIAVSGLLGRGGNARVSNRPDQALSAYQQAAAAFPQSYGAPYALLSEVQILIRQGKAEEAKRVLQVLMTQYAGSAAAQSLGGGSAPAPQSR